MLHLLRLQMFQSLTWYWSAGSSSTGLYLLRLQMGYDHDICSIGIIFLRCPDLDTILTPRILHHSPGASDVPILDLVLRHWKKRYFPYCNLLRLQMAILFQIQAIGIFPFRCSNL